MSACTHQSNFDVLRRWDDPRTASSPVAVCRCCGGPCRAEFVEHPEGGLYGVAVFCTRCPEEVS